MANPPSLAGAAQATVSVLSPGVTASMDGIPGVVCAVPVLTGDHGPASTAFTARTCTSYATPLVRPERAYRRAPELQTPASSVQLASSALSAASVSM